MRREHTLSPTLDAPMSNDHGATPTQQWKETLHKLDIAELQIDGLFQSEPGEIRMSEWISEGGTSRVAYTLIRASNDPLALLVSHRFRPNGRISTYPIPLESTLCDCGTEHWHFRCPVIPKLDACGVRSQTLFRPSNSPFGCSEHHWFEQQLNEEDRCFYRARLQPQDLWGHEVLRPLQKLPMRQIMKQRREFDWVIEEMKRRLEGSDSE